MLFLVGKAYKINEGDEMFFKENLKLLRKRNKLSQDELAATLGYKSFTTIQKWEDGTSMPNASMIQKIALYFSLSIEEFLNNNLAVNFVETLPIPILGTVRTGPGIFAEENITGYEYVISNEALSGEYFYLNVVGDSMKNMRILEGDVVYIRKQASVENGEIAVVYLGDNEVTLKRVIFDEDKMILQPENERYEPMIFTKKEIDEHGIKILGKLIHNKIRY